MILTGAGRNRTRFSNVTLVLNPTSKGQPPTVVQFESIPNASMQRVLQKYDVAIVEVAGKAVPADSLLLQDNMLIQAWEKGSMEDRVRPCYTQTSICRAQVVETINFVQSSASMKGAVVSKNQVSCRVP